MAMPVVYGVNGVVPPSGDHHTPCSDQLYVA
jgi:hypothetical protein